MPASIGVNLRVTGHCRQGGRKYMEDFFSVAYQQTEDEKDLEYAFFGIYDGHGGGEAATYAKEHLMESIVRQKNFWSDKDDDVLKAIKEGYIATHYAMWKEQEKWPKTASGLPSTAGTTASVAFIRRGKIYIGHVGDSGIILGFQDPGQAMWQARPLTEDHKPENKSEMSRIEQCGGKVVTKSGVPRVVWNRPRIGHKGPVRRSTPIDEIPFLAVARSLGDLWSYNSALDEFVVSPDPDTCCITIDADSFRCLIFGTDGLWNMISPATAVGIVQVAEQHNERTVLATTETPESLQPAAGRTSKVWINPSKCLVERALERWSTTRMRADNTSVITLMLDPPGPPRAEVIKNQRLLQETRTKQEPKPTSEEVQPAPVYPENGLEIVTMYGEENSSTVSAVEEQSQKQQDQELQMSPTIQNHELQKQQQDHEQAAKDDKNPRRYTEEYLDKVHREVMSSLQSKSTVETFLNETIQINEVSSSSEKPCAKCTRSHDARPKPRSISESPKRKTRSSRRAPEVPKRKLPELVDTTRLAEPPQKLRRSQSLGPRDFTLRSASDSKMGRSLRDRRSFRRVAGSARGFAPVRQTRNRLKRLHKK